MSCCPSSVARCLAALPCPSSGCRHSHACSYGSHCCCLCPHYDEYDDSDGLTPLSSRSERAGTHPVSPLRHFDDRLLRQLDDRALPMEFCRKIVVLGFRGVGTCLMCLPYGTWVYQQTDFELTLVRILVACWVLFAQQENRR